MLFLRMFLLYLFWDIFVFDHLVEVVEFRTVEFADLLEFLLYVEVL
jgi:hypothetical protein